MSNVLISQAVVAWTGWGETTKPTRNDERLIDRFGSDAALDLIPAVHTLEQEFYESDANQTADSLVEMGKQAAQRFHDLHPEVANDAVEALAWCYVYDFK